jgi:hypothetical protein
LKVLGSWESNYFVEDIVKKRSCQERGTIMSS